MKDTSFKDLPKRFLAGFVSIGVLATLIYFAKTPLFRIVVIFLVLSLCGFAVLEFAHLAELKGAKMKKQLLVMSALVFSLSFYFWPVFSLLPLFVFFTLFLFLFLIHFNKIKAAILSVSASIFSLLYIALPLGLIFPLLYFTAQDGRLWLFYLLAVTKSTDIGGYFGGILFGRKKLAPNLSPKKTVAGFVAGLFLAVFVSYLFAQLSQGAFADGFSLSLRQALILGAVLAVGAQLGDLAESLLKRDAKIKNSGHLPGFGGVLDLLDSLLLNLPVLFFYLEVLR